MNNKIKKKERNSVPLLQIKKWKRQLVKLAQFPSLICISRTWIQIGLSIKTKPEREHVFGRGGFLCSDTIKNRGTK